jgi:acetyl-CoA synthetase
MTESPKKNLPEKFLPSEEFKSKARINSIEEFEKLYSESIQSPDRFWEKLAESELNWERKWDEVLHYDFSAIGKAEGGYLRWFAGGKLNVSYNCLDRHVDAGHGERTAIFWEGDDEAESRSLTYSEVLEKVCQLANALKELGAGPGTAITIYLPMLPETAIAMLACARIGAMHSVVFSAFSADALKSRIEDCGSRIVLTSDIGFHAGKKVPLKEKVDNALSGPTTVENVVVLDRSGQGLKNVSMKEGRDLSWSKIVERQSPYSPPEAFDSENPLFALYTSGSTGKPKGVLHTTAGYLLYAHTTFKYIFDYRAEDVFFCSADVGWITGHSYVVYGPLSNCATVVMYEGVPTYPEADRFWKIIDRYKVSIFYTAPTAIRALMRLGEEIPNGFSLKSLRLLGSVGEPINPEAWKWYYNVIGRGNCPIVDTWWQTENGGILIATLPGVHEMKPGSAGKPFFGIVPIIAAENNPDSGPLFIEKPWPGMLRGVFGDTKAELIKHHYFSRDADRYFSGDGAKIDKDGYFTLLGRIDDVLNVSAHRLSTAELESSLVNHPSVAEAAVVGYPHELKGQAIYCFVTLKRDFKESDELIKALKDQVRKEIGPIATPDKIQFTPALPKTRSGKIMRRILRKIAEGDLDNIGDISTLADPSVVDQLLANRK